MNQQELAILQNHRFKVFKVFLWLNLTILIIITGLTFYAKTASSNVPEYWIRTEVLHELFEDCFRGDRPYFGAINKILELLWGACIMLAALSYWEFPSNQSSIRDTALSKKFLLFTGAIVTSWLVNDIFGIATYIQLLSGISKSFVYLFYAILSITYVISSRRVVFRGSLRVPFISAMIFWFLTSFFDGLDLQGRLSSVILEEGCKLFAILNLFYFLLILYLEVRSISNQHNLSLYSSK